MIPFETEAWGQGAGGNPLVLGLGPASITFLNGAGCLQASAPSPAPQGSSALRPAALCTGVPGSVTGSVGGATRLPGRRTEAKLQ